MFASLDSCSRGNFMVTLNVPCRRSELCKMNDGSEKKKMSPCKLLIVELEFL